MYVDGMLILRIDVCHGVLNILLVVPGECLFAHDGRYFSTQVKAYLVICCVRVPWLIGALSAFSRALNKHFLQGCV